MSWTGGAVAVALGAGVAGAVQVAVMGRFGERIGTLEALAFTTVLGALIATGLLLVVRRSLDGYGDGLGAAPKWLWLGAAIGVFVVASITLAAPEIGTTATVALLIAGQLGAALAIDRFGWFGVDRVSLTWFRILGVVLLVAGAALTLRR